MTDPSVLETDRLLMRRWQAADRDSFAEMNADPEVMRYYAAPSTRAESGAFVDRIEAHFDEHGYGLWALEVRATGAFAGCTGLMWQTYPAHFTPAVEVGWRLRREAWGHGYATEAARAALDYGFGRSGLTEIVSITTPTNLPSRAVMTRLGMTHDPADDFSYPNIPADHPLNPHVLYRLSNSVPAAPRSSP